MGETSEEVPHHHVPNVLPSSSIKVEMMTEEEVCQVKVEGCVCSECSGECSSERSILQDMTGKPHFGSNDEIHGIKEESLEFKVEVDKVKEEVNVRLTDQPQSGSNCIKTEMLDVEIHSNFQNNSVREKMFKFPEEDLATKNSECLKEHQSEVQNDESIQKEGTDGLEKVGKKFNCFTCNYATNKSNNLKQHKMTSKHKEKMFKSSEVDFATKNSKCFKKPRTEVQSDESIQNKRTGGLGKLEKKLRCFFCNYATNKSGNLKQHYMTSKHKMRLKHQQCKNSNTSQHQTNHSSLQFEDPIGDIAMKDGNSLQQHQAEILSDVNIQEEGNVLSKKFEEIEMITAQPGEVCQVKVEGCVCSECSGECSSEQFLQDTRDQP